ncbi:MAG: VWA domain-containing protein [Clostridiales Family XIII bacterium]|jgi:uncharacterized protein with von Willebrand factor type A (vWA) domain|nr:VWA domain-containing protein [Clostridiales Family XIII bacterium]
MFLSFFYLIRLCGLKPSVHQWMTLTGALDLGLANASLTGFYDLCRSVLLTSETDFDKFDEVFLEYFREIAERPEIPPEFLEWLSESPRVTDGDERPEIREKLMEAEELLKRLEERIEEQKSRHDGGTYWIGTGGASTQGHGGYHERGIRVGGEGRHGHALEAIAGRRYRDFREDSILDVRQYQTAFRKLRQFSSRAQAARTELDLDETVRATSANAGGLRLVYERPRRNTVKLLVLFDCAGSMEAYARLTSRLFKAVSGANHFKDLRCYYFHNCVYDKLYTTPMCTPETSVGTDLVFRTLSGEYRAIFVGDAAMAPYELYRKSGVGIRGIYDGEPAIERLRRFRRKFPRAVWLNPIPRAAWENGRGHETIEAIAEIFPMYELTLRGIEQAIRRLLAPR